MPAGLSFNVYGRDVSASRAIRGVGDEATHTGSKLKKFGAVAGAALAGAGIATFLKDSITGWQDHERIVRQSEAVIKSTGGVAGITADSMNNLADSVERKTGVDGDAILEGENLLATFTNIRNEAGKGNDIFDQSTSLMVDLSAAMGQDAKTSAVQLGKALNDPIAGVSKLTKVGVTFTQAQRDQIKAMQDAGNIAGAQKIILAELSREFGGSAAAQETASDKMMVAFRQLQDSVGQALTPVIETLAGVLTNDVIPAFNATVGWLKQNWDWLKYVAGGVIAATVAWKAFRGVMVVSAAWSAAQAGLAGVGLALSGLPAKANAAGLAMSKFRASSAMGATAALGVVGAVVGIGFALNKAFGGESDAEAHIGTLADAMNSAAQAGRSFRDALYESNGVITTNIKLGVAKQLQDSEIAAAAAKARISLADLTDGVTGNDVAFQALVKRWKDKGASSGLLAQLIILRDNFKGAKGAAATLTQTQGAYDQANVKTKTAVKNTTDSMKEQTAAADALKNKIKALSDDKIGAAQAELRFRDGLAEASSQVKENGRSLDANTTKGRANREWLLNQITSVHDVAQAQLDAGQKTSVVTARMYLNEAALRKAATSAGLNKDQVDSLIRTYGKVPTHKSTRISVPGLIQAMNEALTFEEALNRLRHTAVTVQGGGTTGGRSRYTNAQGTGFFRGDTSLVGENGPEMVRLPRGSQVLPSTQSRSLARFGGGGGSVIVNVNVQGSVLSERELIGAIERQVSNGVKIRAARGII